MDVKTQRRRGTSEDAEAQVRKDTSTKKHRKSQSKTPRNQETQKHTKLHWCRNVSKNTCYRTIITNLQLANHSLQKTIHNYRIDAFSTFPNLFSIAGRQKNAEPQKMHATVITDLLLASHSHRKNMHNDSSSVLVAFLKKYFVAGRAKNAERPKMYVAWY